MHYIEAVRDLVEGKTRSGNALEHGLSEIVQEARAKGCSRRHVMIMRNAYFRSAQDMRAELTEFCEAFELALTETGDGTMFEFWNKVRGGPRPRV